MSENEYVPQTIEHPAPERPAPEPHVRAGQEIELPLPREEDPRKKKYTSDQDGLRAAAREVVKERDETNPQADPASPVDRSYQYLTGDRAGEKLEPEHELSLEKASDDLTRIRAWEKSVEQPNIAEGVDQFRAAVAEAQQPQPEAQTAEQRQVDPLQQALSDPRIRAALEQEVAQVESARQQYATATWQAAQLAAGSLFASYPELMNFNSQQLPIALATIEKTDPVKAAKIQAHIGQVQQLYQASQAIQAQQQQQQAAQLAAWTKAESDKCVGPYAGNDVKLTRVPHPDWETKDISRKVDSAQKIDDGFSGKLPNND
jgi:hypothetical protein